MVSRLKVFQNCRYKNCIELERLCTYRVPLCLSPHTEYLRRFQTKRGASLPALRQLQPSLNPSCSRNHPKPLPNNCGSVAPPHGTTRSSELRTTVSNPQTVNRRKAEHQTMLQMWIVRERMNQRTWEFGGNQELRESIYTICRQGQWNTKPNWPARDMDREFDGHSAWWPGGWLKSTYIIQRRETNWSRMKINDWERKKDI